MGKSSATQRGDFGVGHMRRADLVAVLEQACARSSGVCKAVASRHTTRQDRIPAVPAVVPQTR